MRFVKQNGWFRATLILTCIAMVMMSLAIAPRDEVFADDGELAAVFRNGSLEVNVPNDQFAARGQTLGLEILEPHDLLLAKAVRFPSGGRSTKVAIPLDRSIALEDLAWDRLRISTIDATKIVSISEILRVPVVRLFAQRAYAAGSPASVRIITADSKTGDPIRDSRVKLELVDDDRATMLFSGRTGASSDSAAMRRRPNCRVMPSARAWLEFT